MKTFAFAPAHISGIFNPIFNKDNYLKSGSTGAGININYGAKTEAILEKSQKQIFEFYINNKKSDSQLLEDALKFLVGELNVKITIRTNLDLPIGQGFGMSASSTLSSCLSTSKLLGIPKNIALNASHYSEVKNMTGLGDVLASNFGGVEIRTKPGLPPWGSIKKIPGNYKLVLCIIGEPLNTKDILNEKKILLKIKEFGNKYTKKLNQKPTIENLFLYSEKFTRTIDIASDDILKAINSVNKFGRSSMCMLGNSIFAIGNTKKITEILSPFGEVYLCNIDNKGARIIID